MVAGRLRAQRRSDRPIQKELATDNHEEGKGYLVFIRVNLRLSVARILSSPLQLIPQHIEIIPVGGLDEIKRRLAFSDRDGISAI